MSKGIKLLVRQELVVLQQQLLVSRHDRKGPAKIAKIERFFYRKALSRTGRQHSASSLGKIARVASTAGAQYDTSEENTKHGSGPS